MAHDWRDDAACQGIDPEVWFPLPKDTMAERRALAICTRCPVRDECLDWAVTHRITYGIWGGATEGMRRAKPAKPAMPAMPVTCPRCHKVRDRSHYIGRGERVHTRCNTCRAGIRKWEQTRRNQGIA